MTALLVTLLVLFACGLAATLYLFLGLKKDAADMLRTVAEQQNRYELETESLRSGFEGLKAEFQDLEERAGMLVRPAPVPSGLDLNKRAQALRMFRRGDSPEQVAAALNLPTGELLLLSKILRLTTSNGPH